MTFDEAGAGAAPQGTPSNTNQPSSGNISNANPGPPQQDPKQEKGSGKGGSKITEKGELTLDLDAAKNLVSKAKKGSTRMVGSVTKSSCLEVISEVANAITGADINMAFLLIAGLMQVGGSNAGACTRVSYEIENKVLNGEQFAGCCRKRKFTVRQISKCMTNELHEFAVILEEPGNFF